MFETLKEIYTKFDYDIKKIKKYEYLTDYILDLYNNKNIEIDSSDVNKLLWNGNYYENIEKNYDEMKKYYLMAIELGNIYSMNNLGHYYETIEKNYDKMKKYYLMAFENGNNNGLYYLMEYYRLYNTNNYKELEDILLLYFEKGNKEVIIYLAKYYEKFEIDYDKMEKYYLIGI